MTPTRMAELHRAAFGEPYAWDTKAIEGMLNGRQTRALHENNEGFALVRTIGPESELLTIAVNPAHQGRGIGRQLLSRWLAQPGLQVAFLEVAADNSTALGLYESLGFRQTGLRRGYYARHTQPNVDAITMTCALVA